MFNFDSFGPKGAEFTRFWADFWMACESFWPRLAAEYDIRKDFESAISTAWNPTNFWYGRLQYLSQSEGFGIEPAGRLEAFWQVFRESFKPCLSATPNKNSLTTSECLATCQHAVLGKRKQLMRRRLEMDSINYGPFSESQLCYLGRFDRLWEVGCGSGYLIKVLRDRGVSAYGCDNDRFQIMGNYPWTAQLESSGHILRGGPEALPDDCSELGLILSWPEPGSSFAAETLSLYRQRGGRDFLFKVGGFVGHHKPAEEHRAQYQPPANPGRNIEALFLELATYWQQHSSPAPYDPNMFWNNLWAFECREEAVDLEGHVRDFEDAETERSNRARKKRNLDRKREKKLKKQRRKRK